MDLAISVSDELEQQCGGVGSEPGVAPVLWRRGASVTHYTVSSTTYLNIYNLKVLGSGRTGGK